MSGADKFMPMYWGDYARDTGDLNNAGHGAYLMLIKHYWGSARPLPDDDGKLWRIACCDSIGAWKKLRPTIEPFFTIEAGMWRHGRIDRELAKATERYERRSKAGQKGNSTRWPKDRNATGGEPLEPEAGAPNASVAPSQCDPNAIPMRSQPQPQPHLLTENTPQLGPVLPAASTLERSEISRSNDLIRAFDQTIGEIWGDSCRRPFPTGTDTGTAQRWLKRGVTPELVRAVADPRMRRLKANSKPPPRALAFIDAAIDDTIAEASKTSAPLPGAMLDADREAAAARFNAAFNRWADGGREGPPPTREQFGLSPRVAAA